MGSEEHVIDISRNDRRILRELAKRVAEIGHDPVQNEKAELWRRHNDLEAVRPMILTLPQGSWRELLPESELQTSEDCPLRGLERDLRERIYYRQNIDDDTVIEPRIACPLVIRNTGWGIETRCRQSEDPTGADRFESVIEDAGDLDKIQKPEISVDRQTSRRRYEQYEDLFGDILDVEMEGRTGIKLAPMDVFARWRGHGRVLMDVVDNPDLVHRGLEKIVDGFVGMITQLEQQDALSLNNRNHNPAQGGTGYTSELPQDDFDGEHVRLCDMWGFSAAQIFADVSPRMHEEFTLHHEKRFLSQCGLNSYGCCEPLHDKLDMVKKIPRIRRVSISPWADIEQSAAELQDKYIYSWKPNPSIIAGEGWDPDHAREYVRDFLRQTEGCVVEIIMKDTHTCRNEPKRIREWTDIVREEVDRFMDGKR
ncbi:MAG: hypothetical protein ACLFWL_16995 [Candidatus Brocadiia bacterium]